ncbi:hypothetical protein BDZ45DRAFT_751181 [Acephala macrosclerotiorum]|nr:hypothetical protein BDZ45DRAFT_751181 [Acephala macrosclerotiorum]
MVYTCTFYSFTASSTNTLLAHRLTTCSPYQNFSKVFIYSTFKDKMVVENQAVDNQESDLPSQVSPLTQTDTVATALVLNELVSLETMQSKFDPLKPHQCPTCAKGFKNNDHLKAHFGSVHLGQKEMCKRCGSKYSNKANLANHIRKKHR